MTAWMQRNPFVLGMAAVAVLLLLVLVLEVGTGGPRIPEGVSRRVSPAEARLLPPVVAAAPEQAYPETANRPLFTPTRRPAPEATATGPSIMQKGQYALLGVTMAGKTRIALLRDKTSGRIHRVEGGKDFNGMRVSQIERESVVLTMGDDKEMLSLNVQKAGAPGATPNPGANLGAGPFGATAASAAEVAAAPAQPQAGAQPIARTANPFGTNANQPPGATGSSARVAPGVANPSSSAVPQATTAPMTPEELLARRRARRAQPPQ